MLFIIIYACMRDTFKILYLYIYYVPATKLTKTNSLKMLRRIIKVFYIYIHIFTNPTHVKLKKYTGQ